MIKGDLRRLWATLGELRFQSRPEIFFSRKIAT